MEKREVNIRIFLLIGLCATLFFGAGCSEIPPSEKPANPISKPPEHIPDTTSIENTVIEDVAEMLLEQDEPPEPPTFVPEYEAPPVPQVDTTVPL